VNVRRRLRQGTRSAALLVLIALAATSCGSSTAATSSRVGTPRSDGSVAVVVSKATGSRSDAPIDLRRVVVRTTATHVTARFTTNGQLDRTRMSAPFCGQVGLNFVAAHVTVQSSARLQSNPAETSTPDNGATVDFVNTHTLELSVPRSSLGGRFTPTTPWIAFSNGPDCPPMNVAEDALPVVSPSA
jgi:hypothetical protein